MSTYISMRNNGRVIKMMTSAEVDAQLGRQPAANQNTNLGTRTVFVCNCGSTLFELRPDWSYCAFCGAKTGWPG